MLEQFCDDFLAVVPLQLPELLDKRKMEKPVKYDDYVLPTFQLNTSFIIEEVMDMLEGEIEVIILYHHIPSHHMKFGHSCCAYSNPSLRRMFKVDGSIDERGMVGQIKVTIYDSLEHMPADVCLDLNLHCENGFFKHMKPKEEVLLNFIRKLHLPDDSPVLPQQRSILLSAIEAKVIPQAPDHLIKEMLYMKTIHPLDRHHTWLEIENIATVRNHTIVRNGGMIDILSRVLVAKTIHHHFPYTRGQVRQIVEYGLEQAIKSFRAVDEVFRQGIIKRELTLEDVERIIPTATHGAVQPDLSPLPLFTCYTYYDK